MARRRIKRIAIGPTKTIQGEWSDRWIDFAATRSRAIAFGKDVVVWGWLASMLGVALWVFLLFLGLDISFASEFRASLGWFDLRPPYYQLFAISILLFLHGSISLFVRYATVLPKSGRFGLVVMCVGLVIAAANTFGLFVTEVRGIFQIFGKDSSQAQFGGLLNVLTINGSYFAQLDWFSRASPGFILVSVGLVFFYVAAVKTKITPMWFALIMVLTSVCLHLPKLLLDAGHLGSDLEYFLFEQIVFTLMLVLFGANWLWVGVILFREQQKARRLTLLPESI